MSVIALEAAAEPRMAGGGEKPAAKKQYFTPEELVERWEGKISRKTLSNWRTVKARAKKGPPWRKIGGRVLYPVETTLAWEKARDFN